MPPSIRLPDAARGGRRVVGARVARDAGDPADAAAGGRARRAGTRSPDELLRAALGRLLVLVRPPARWARRAGRREGGARRATRVVAEGTSGSPRVDRSAAEYRRRPAAQAAPRYTRAGESVGVGVHPREAGARDARQPAPRRQSPQTPRRSCSPLLSPRVPAAAPRRPRRPLLPRRRRRPPPGRLPPRPPPRRGDPLGAGVGRAPRALPAGLRDGDRARRAARRHGARAGHAGPSCCDADETVIDNSTYQLRAGAAGPAVRRRELARVDGAARGGAAAGRGRVPGARARARRQDRDRHQPRAGRVPGHRGRVPRSTRSPTTRCCASPTPARATRTRASRPSRRGTTAAGLPPLEMVAFVGDNIQRLPAARPGAPRAARTLRSPTSGRASSCCRTRCTGAGSATTATCGESARAGPTRPAARPRPCAGPSGSACVRPSGMRSRLISQYRSSKGDELERRRRLGAAPPDLEVARAPSAATRSSGSRRP